MTADFSMIFQAKRLETYKNWPFTEDCNCNPTKMAEAGFYHCPTSKEPDVVRCFVCFKELDGWEPDDDPWLEHKSHSKTCPFVELYKPEADLLLEQFLMMEVHRQENLKLQRMANQIKRIKDQHKLKAKEFSAKK